MVVVAESFVIHAHSGHGPLHYDFMLEQGHALVTWRLPCPPHVLATGTSMEAKKIQDHRPAYLDYQGPVSNHRGRVSRVDRGEYEALDQSDTCWKIRLLGECTQGRYELRLQSPRTERWSLTRVSED
jgi:DNA polymerase ligase (LigD)-like protein